MTTAEMNAALRDAAPGEIKIPRNTCFLADTGEVKFNPENAREFSMVALTGKPLAHWWYGTLGIDLGGIQYKTKLAVLKDHDTEQRLGYTTTIKLDAGRGLVAEGRFLDNDHARAVLKDHAEGFPWQASTYLQATRVERVAPGETAELNGGQITGPAVIFRASVLREVTFTALGADDDTSATPLSADAGQHITATLIERLNMTKQTEAEQAKNTGGTAAPVAQDPAKNDAALKDAVAAAAKAERERASAILSSCASEQVELGRKLVEDGTPLTEALLAINKDLRLRVAGTAPQRGDNTASLAAGNREDAAPAPTDEQKLAALPEGEEKWSAQWKADAKLRDEFMGNEKAWLAYKRNEGRTRDYGTAR